MARSQHDIDLTIIEIIRYGGLLYPDAESILSETLTEEQRRELCRALEQWEMCHARCGECGVSFLEAGVIQSEHRRALCDGCAYFADLDEENGRLKAAYAS